MLKHRKMRLVASILAVVMSAGCIFGCSEGSNSSSTASTSSACQHKNVTTSKLEPTCTSVGYKKDTCKDCGDEDYTILDALGHSWK